MTLVAAPILKVAQPLSAFRKKAIALTFATVLVEVHGDGEVEVFRAEGPVGVMRLA